MEKRSSQIKLSLKIFFSNPTAVIGLIIFLAYVIDAIIVEVSPGLLGIQNPNQLQMNFINPVPQPPSPHHPLGTTYPGIDLLKGILAAIRIDLYYSVIIVIGGAIIGSVIGIIAGYRGGIMDDILMRITDIFFAIPYLVLALAIGFVLGRTTESMSIALIIVWWPLYARYARAQTLSIKKMPFIDAAKVSNVGSLKIMFKHVLPNVLPPIFVQISLDLGSIMVIFSVLSFIGLITNPNLPELGYLTSLGLQYIQTAPWTVIFPGLAITIFALAVNLMGDGLRDLLDPRRRSSI
ncbi:peptide ABC transporter permease [Sulfolobus acidocaldarius SUSAZ]|nr:peptide ABC transporter permease [Sulfolobus acidocaldarius SUSAZ]